MRVRVPLSTGAPVSERCLKPEQVLDMQPGAILNDHSLGAADVEKGPGSSPARAGDAGTPPSAPTILRHKPRSHKLGSRSPRAKAGPNHSPAPRTGTVTANELQSAVLFILGLYASVAVLNLGAEFSRIAQSWQTLMEFLAGFLF